MECIYESEEIRDVTGSAIRPGGLALTEHALSFVRLPAGANVLDVGCGIGATVEFLRKHRYSAFGVDTSSLLLKEGVGSGTNPGLVKAKAEHLPFPDRCFSALFCECVLSLLADPAEALEEFARVLSPGGYLVLSDVYARLPDNASSFRDLPVHCCITGAVGRRQTAATVEGSGFSTVIWEDHSGVLNQLAARLVFSFGSLNAFWAATCCGGDPEAIRQTVQRGRPGYYLLIATKKPSS